MITNTRTRVLVSLDNIRDNFEAMRRNIPEHTKIVAVIKANGYGHGAVPIAKMMEDTPWIWGFAVAVPQEAQELREAGITKPILILGITFKEDVPDLIRMDVRMALSSYEQAKEISEAAQQLGREALVHIALDTGMTRIGFKDNEEGADLVQKALQLPGIHAEGMFTHFARADEYDRTPALVQQNRYLAFKKMLEDREIRLELYHTSNSAGIIRVPEAHMDLVRAGITVYGIYPSNEVERDIVKLKPALTWKACVSYVKTIEKGDAISYGGTFTADKTMRVATIPVGYADGYPRGLSNKGYVLIRGRKAPILGRVCMDQFMVDVTEIPEAAAHDEVTLIGRDGEEEISIEVFGDLSGRFSYEFACDISLRVPRVYILDGKEI